MLRKPQPWTTQPPIGTPIDKKHRLYKDIRAVYMAGPGRMYDCFNYAKKPHTEQGNAVKDETAGGWKYNVDSGEKLYMSPTGRKINDLCGPEGQTIYVWYDLDAVTGYGNIISHEVSNDDVDINGWFISSSNEATQNFSYLYLRFIDGTNYRGWESTTNALTAAQKDMQFVFRTDSNRIEDPPLDMFYRKGLGADITRHPLQVSAYTTKTGSMTPPADETAIRLGYRAAASDLDGKFKLVILWNGALSEADARSILLNPWQIFEAPPLFYGASTSGSFTETLTPSGVGTAALSKTLSLSKALTLGGTGTSVSSKLMALSRSLTPSGTGTASVALGISAKILEYAAYGTAALTKVLALSREFAITALGAPRLNKGGDLEGAVNPQDALPRDLPRIHEFIVNNGGPWAGSLQDDYRTALCVAVGYTEEQALAINISDAWALYAADRNL